MNNECLASLITVSLKVTIDKVQKKYRSRFIFVRYSDVSFFCEQVFDSAIHSL